MTSGYETFKLYHAICLHFQTPSYDFIQYKGKTNVTPNAWHKRNDQYQFEVLGSKYKTDQLIGMIVSWFIQDIDVRPPRGPELLHWAQTGYLKWLASIEAQTNNFVQDLHILRERTNGKLLTAFRNDHGVPEIVNVIVNKDIGFTSAVILLDLITGSIEEIDKCGDEFIWPAVKNRINKYRPFLQYDKKKYADLVRSHSKGV